MNIPKVIDVILKNDLCIGCGICVSQCPSNALEMTWNDSGFLTPEHINNCNSDGVCLKVCPFNPFPNAEVKTEKELANVFFEKNKNRNNKIGKYNQIYVGFSKEFRLSSSSGGVGTYICSKLLDKGIVDYVFSVQESSEEGVFYEYSINSTKYDLLKSAKTRYFPVTLATVFSEINKLEGKIAIVGVGCFIKAIRLAQHNNPKLKEKITFLIGIICGGVKSRFFTEYLASKMNLEAHEINKPQFRKKDTNSTANDYSFSCLDNNSEEKSIKMSTVGDMWGTGLFKANACDFCDDVTTELADISLGDAWLHPYYLDGKGTNVIVTRSFMADNLIKEGIDSGELVLKNLPLDAFLASQQGSFNHRHLGLLSRIKDAKKNGQLVPPKRFEKEQITIDFRWVQKQRMMVRAKSLEIWKKNPDAKTFDKAMKVYLKNLKFYTKIYHLRRKYQQKINKIINIVKGNISKETI